MKESVIIIGGGASGLFCALRLADLGQKNITLLERGERVGKKLSSTGNGQGNLTNRNMGVEHYFSDDTAKVKDVLTCFDQNALLEYMEGVGGLFFSDERGRVYPTGRQASSLTDLLRFALAKKGVNVVTGEQVIKISCEKVKYSLTTNTNKYEAAAVVFATGGKAAKNFGTDGQGYQLVKSLGHSVTPLFPALVQLKTDVTDIKGLRGVRCECVVTAKAENTQKTAVGDVIFTDYGVSGNAVFTLSSYLTDKVNGKIEIDFLPQVDEGKLCEVLTKKMACKECEPLGCIVNNQLGRAICRRVARQGSLTACALAREVKHFSLLVTGTLGFDYAQVTRGGVPMGEVDENLQSKKAVHAYLCGEILNVDGECGGYNLQWAFSSAERVARAIAKEE